MDTVDLVFLSSTVLLTKISFAVVLVPRELVTSS